MLLKEISVKTALPAVRNGVVAMLVKVGKVVKRPENRSYLYKRCFNF